MILVLFYRRSDGGKKGGEVENVHGNSSVINARV